MPICYSRGFFKLIVYSVISYDVDSNKPCILNSAFSHRLSDFYFAENGEHTFFFFDSRDLHATSSPSTKMHR